MTSLLRHQGPQAQYPVPKDERLTVRQRLNSDVLCGHAGTVLIVGHHSETVLCVFFQPVNGVRVTRNIDILE